MANLKLKKADLKGPLTVGGGWLIATAWAVKVGDDQRLQSVETVNAAFAGLDVSAALRKQVELLNRALVLHERGGHHRTAVLIEGEDGVLTRVYRTRGGNNICLREDFVRILGDPNQVFSAGEAYCATTGFIAKTTDQPPAWALDTLS